MNVILQCAEGLSEELAKRTYRALRALDGAIGGTIHPVASGYMEEVGGERWCWIVAFRDSGRDLMDGERTAKLAVRDMNAMGIEV